MNFYLSVTDKDYKNTMIREYNSLYNRIEEYSEIGMGSVVLREDVDYFLSKLNKDLSSLDSIISRPQDTRTLCKVCSISFEDYVNDIQNKLQDLTRFKETLLNLIEEMS
jgi:hypothetical protein